MVVGAFPVIKLAALLMKQLSKPIANLSKERAKNNYFFRTYICMPPAQFYNWCEVQAKMWALNLGKPTKVPQLNETMAIELGANLLGETIVFGIAAGILFVEYNRQTQKELVKEKNRQEELSTLNYTIQQLYFQVERQDAQIKELLESMSNLEKTHSFTWKLSSKDKKPSSPSSSPPPTPPTVLVLPATPLVTDPEAVIAAQRKAAEPAQNASKDKQAVENVGENNKSHEKPHAKASVSEWASNSILYEALASLQGRIIPFNNLEVQEGFLKQAVNYVEKDVYHKHY